MPDLSQCIAARKQLIKDRDATREQSFLVLVPAISAWLEPDPRSAVDPISGRPTYRFDYSAQNREASSVRQLTSLTLQSFNGSKFECSSPDDDSRLHISGFATFAAISIVASPDDPFQGGFIRQVKANVTDSIYLQHILFDFEAKVVALS